MDNPLAASADPSIFTLICLTSPPHALADPTPETRERGSESFLSMILYRSG